jgi:hypothetical protein
MPHSLVLFLSFRSAFLNRWSNLLFALAQSLQLIETRSTLPDMLEEYREFRIPRMNCESREGIVSGTVPTENAIRRECL